MSTNITILFNSHQIAILSLLLVLCLGCGDERSERPSPLKRDSISLGTTVIQIEYSSPRVKKRKVWGELVPYEAVWRTGANKATYIKTSSDLIISDELLEKGKYSLFTIPRENNKWTIIFNREWDQWGSYNYDESKDALRVDVDIEISSFTEDMTFSLDSSTLNFEWENLKYGLQYELFQ